MENLGGDWHAATVTPKGGHTLTDTKRKNIITRKLVGLPSLTLTAASQEINQKYFPRCRD